MFSAACEGLLQTTNLISLGTLLLALYLLHQGSEHVGHLINLCMQLPVFLVFRIEVLLVRLPLFRGADVGVLAVSGIMPRLNTELLS